MESTDSPNEEAVATSSNSSNKAAKDINGSQEAGAAPSGQGAKEPGQPDMHIHTVFKRAEIGQFINANIVGGSRGLKPQLTRRDFKESNHDCIVGESRGIIVEKSSVDALVKELFQKRIMILASEARTGKARVAVVTARQLWEEGNLQAMLLLPHAPDRNVKLSLTTLVDEIEAAHHLVVLQDAFDDANVDLHRFFIRLTSSRVEEIAATLRERGSFLLLTSDYDRLGAQIEHKLREQRILYELQPLSSDRLKDGLRERVKVGRKGWTEKRPDLEGKVDTTLTTCSTTEIVGALKTMPRIVEFVDDWFLQIATGDITIEEAIRRVTTPANWLLFDLPDNFDDWCYALALALCHAAVLPAPLPWLQFDLVRRELTRFLRRELRVGAKPTGLPHFDDDATCRTARAEVRWAPGSPGNCCIGFRDKTLAEEIWEVLLGSGRRILGHLYKFCEQHLLSEMPIAEVAARALGRIGEMDSQGIVPRWISDLRTLDQEQRASRLGNFFQGILSSRSRPYREESLWYLRLQLSSGTPADVSATARSLFWVGILNTEFRDLALDNLRSVAKQKLLNPFRDIYRCEGELNRRDEWIQAAKKQSVHFQYAEAEEKLFASLDLLFPEESDLSLLLSIEQTLIRLCLYYGPTWLFMALRTWMKDPEPLLRPLTALLFLGSGGIADQLEAFKVPLSVSEASEECVVGDDVTFLATGVLTGDREDIDLQTGFLEDIFKVFRDFPGLIHQEFVRRLHSLFKSWARQGLARQETRNIVLDNFQRILGTDSKMSRDICAWIRKDPDFAKADSELALLRPLAVNANR